MEAGKLREDIVSPLLKIATYKGYTLIGSMENINFPTLYTGPKEAIVRRVYSSQSQSAGLGAGAAGGDSSFTQLNFRLLGTSPASMLNARVRLVVPLRFYAPVGDVVGVNDTRAAGAEAWDQLLVGPRRNGLLKSFSTISTIINNTTSFSVRPDESLAVAEQAFPQVREFGATGVNNTEEGGWWGPDWRGSGQISVDNTTAAGYPIGDMIRLGAIQATNYTTSDNRAAAERRTEFLAQTARENGSAIGTTYVNRRVVTYDYVTDLFIPPFKKFDYPTVSKAPTYIKGLTNIHSPPPIFKGVSEYLPIPSPYADQIEVACHWKSLNEIKANLLLGKGRYQFGDANRFLTAYSLQYAGQPYIDCEYIVPNFSIPPVVTLPCWRTIHYQHDVDFSRQADGLALVNGTDSPNLKQVDMAPIRIESLPSLIFVWVSDPSIRDSLGTEDNGNPSGAIVHGSCPGFHLREYFGKISNFSVIGIIEMTHFNEPYTLNERLRVLSDRSNMDFYRMFRMYCPNSKMDYFTWSELRQLIVFRSDILCTDASQSVFSPTTITFKMDIQRQIQNRSKWRSKCKQRVNVLFWYGNEAISLSSQSSSVTSLLLNKSDVREVRVGAGSSAITEIMARNQ